MAIEYECDHCEAVLSSPISKAGIRLNCPVCEHEVTVPFRARPLQRLQEAEYSKTAHQFENGRFSGCTESTHEDQEPQAFTPTHVSIQRKRSSAFAVCACCQKVFPSDRKYCTECFDKSSLAFNPVYPTALKITGEAFHRFSLNFSLISTVLVWQLLRLVIVVVTLTIGHALVSDVLRNWNPFWNTMLTLIVWLLVVYLLSAATFQRTRICLAIARSSNLTYRDLTRRSPFTRRTPRQIAIQSTYFVAWATGLLVMVLPGISIMIRFWPIRYLIADEDRDAFSAAVAVFHMTNRRIFLGLQLFLIYCVSLLILSMIPVLGFLIALWWGDVFYSVAYLSMKSDSQLLEQNRSDLWGTASERERSD